MVDPANVRHRTDGILLNIWWEDGLSPALDSRNPPDERACLADPTAITFPIRYGV